MSDVVIRPALHAERSCLEALQWRASLANSGRSSRILHVVGNPHAEGFYAACGFRITGAVETRFGSGLAMQRELGHGREPAKSAPPRGLDGGDVDLLHRHHCREGTLGLTATSRKRLG
jgi:hypothetical protein